MTAVLLSYVRPESVRQVVTSLKAYDDILVDIVVWNNNPNITLKTSVRAFVFFLLLLSLTSALIRTLTRVPFL